MKRLPWYSFVPVLRDHFHLSSAVPSVYSAIWLEVILTSFTDSSFGVIIRSATQSRLFTSTRRPDSCGDGALAARINLGWFSVWEILLVTLLPAGPPPKPGSILAAAAIRVSAIANTPGARRRSWKGSRPNRGKILDFPVGKCPADLSVSVSIAAQPRADGHGLRDLAHFQIDVDGVGLLCRNHNIFKRFFLKPAFRR